MIASLLFPLIAMVEEASEVNSGGDATAMVFG
jgi:hypothetical protein